MDQHVVLSETCDGAISTFNYKDACCEKQHCH